MMEEAGRAVAGGDADVVGGHRHHAHGRRLLPRRALPLALGKVAPEDQAEGHARRAREDPRRIDAARRDLIAAEPDRSLDIRNLCSLIVFSSKFYICSEDDFHHLRHLEVENQTSVTNPVSGGQAKHVCSEGHEPFVSYEGLGQLHRFLFILGITHVLYSFVTVVLSMIKIYSWRKWETLAGPIAAEEMKARRTRVMQRQSTIVFKAIRRGAAIHPLLTA